MLEREVFVSLCAPFTFATHRHATRMCGGIFLFYATVLV